MADLRNTRPTFGHPHPRPVLGPDGRTNLVRVGMHPSRLGDLYHFLLVSPWLRLLLIISLLYCMLNTMFALAYLAGGPCIENARPGSFADAFFFSVQTLATVGYGKMTPIGLYGNVLMSFEALVGIVSTALATGLMFAKFARPTARVRFSKTALIATSNGVPTLMWRMANARGNQIVEAQVQAMLIRNERTAEGESIRRFHDLALSRNHSPVFALTWTAFHPINEGSPLLGQTLEMLVASEAQIIVVLTGFDESFMQTVHARWTYSGDEIHWGGKFADLFSNLPDGTRMIDYTGFDVVLPPQLAVGESREE